jgi:sugar lactone lactonase YvrE
VYVVDKKEIPVQKFDSNGKFITKWASEGEVDGRFDFVNDVSLDSSGSIYVADSWSLLFGQYHVLLTIFSLTNVSLR